MSRRTRYEDKSAIGKSSLVPYRKGENPKQRHDRRLRKNLHWKDDLKRWAHKNSFRVDIKNEGHHWILIRSGLRVEWWPSSAKLIINQKWDEGVHCHDYKQLIVFLQKMKS